MITIAADLGGTEIKLGVVKDGRVAKAVSFPARSGKGLWRQLPRLKDAADQALAALGLDSRACDALGLAFPGLVEPGAAKVRATYGKWDDACEIDFAAWAQAQFSLPLVMENDTRLALLGEWRAGAGQGTNDMVLITLGTGLGTAAIVEGRLLTGIHGQAGVLGGHFSIDRGGALCTCGNIGCAEAEASTSVLPRLAAAHVGFAASAMAGRGAIDYALVFELARKGDSCARALKAHSIAVWAQMAVNLIHAYDPQRLIVGGGIMAGAGDFFASLKTAILARAHTPWGRVDIVPASLGASAALVGLDALARLRLGEKP